MDRTTAFVDLVQASPLFDHLSYRSRAGLGRCTDRAAAAAHYVEQGRELGLDPGPGFCAASYLALHPEVQTDGHEAFEHFLRFGQEESFAIVPAAARHQGRLAAHRGHRRVLVAAHLAGTEVFGAERSLLDLLDGFVAIGIDTVVALPTTSNSDYLELVRERCTTVETLPLLPALRRHHPPAAATARLAAVIRRHRVQAVHVNTIVPVEAMLAAHECEVPCVVHAREVPFDDPDLCEWLGDPAQAIVDRVLELADFVVAPAVATLRVYAKHAACAVVRNVVTGTALQHLHRDPTRRVRIGLVGSPTEKKGIHEFLELARRFQGRHDALFVVVGPESPTTTALRATGRLPHNLRLVGYRPDPVAAMAEVDVLVNMSRCQESFNRSAIEAMASGIPVVAFDRGGLGEAVVEGITGFLVPPDDLDTMAERVDRLVHDAQLRTTLGASGRERVARKFCPERLAGALLEAYDCVLPPAQVRAQQAHDLVVQLPFRNRTVYPDMFYVGARGRFSTASTVRFLGNDRAVVSSLVAREIHLLALDADASELRIVNTLRTIDDHGDVSVDLIDLQPDPATTGMCGALVVAANCEASSLSFYDARDNHITYLRSMPVDPNDVPYCHGTSFVGGRPDLVAAVITTLDPRVAFHHMNGSVAPPPFRNAGWIPKGAAFCGELMVVAASRHNVVQSPDLDHSTRVMLVRLDDHGDHTVLDTYDLPQSAADGISTFDDHVFVSDQPGNQVVELRVQRPSRGQPHLRLVRRHLGVTLPHDAAVSPDGRWLAVACYDGTVRIRRR